MGTFITLLIMAAIFIGVPYIIFTQLRKNQRLRNLQLKDEEERDRERRQKG
jgi:cbb3-type cytochrome oxidase subunit 3